MRLAAQPLPPRLLPLPPRCSPTQPERAWVIFITHRCWDLEPLQCVIHNRAKYGAHGVCTSSPVGNSKNLCQRYIV